MKIVFAVAIYNVSSPQRLVDVARLVYGCNITDMLVVVRPTGMAAQVGLPEVSKLAYRRSKKLLVLASAQELHEILPGRRLIFIVHGVSGVSYLEDTELKGDEVIVVHGGDGTFTRSELALGEAFTLKGFEELQNPVADVAITLYHLITRGRVGE